MANKKTIKEQRIEELIQALLSFGNNKLSKLEITVLTEVLINGVDFKDLTSTLHLTTHRQKQIFDTAISRITKALAVVSESEDTSAYSAMKRELAETKKELETLEKSIEAQNRLSPKMKMILAIKIETSGLSARVKSVCYRNEIHTVSDLVKYSRRDFGNLRDSGKKSIDEVEVFLEAHELSWR